MSAGLDHQKGQTHSRIRGSLFIAAIVAGLLLAVLTRWLGIMPSEASHPFTNGGGKPDPHRHIFSMTRAEQDDFCIESASIGPTDAAEQLYSILTDDLGWEKGINSSNLKFRAHDSCVSARPDEIRVLIVNDPCTSGPGRSCVDYGLAVINEALAHWEYYDVDVNYHTPHFSSTRIVNHEIGHVLGLRDGGPTGPTPPPQPTPYCPTDPKSVMHNEYYGCPAGYDTNNDWPSSSDFDSVRDNYIPSTGSSAGGFSKGGSLF